MRTLRATGGSGFPGKVIDNARSLGAWINSFGSFAHEKHKRVEALRQAKIDAGPLLRQVKLPYQLKRIFLVCYIKIVPYHVSKLSSSAPLITLLWTQAYSKLRGWPFAAKLLIATIREWSLAACQTKRSFVIGAC